MKKFLVLTIALVLMSTSAFAEIALSKHDFGQTGGFNATSTQICEPCHVPHNASNASAGPLWNHASTTVTSYTLYSSPTGTLDATDLAQPSAGSKICLGCHDGTVAVDAFGGATGTTTIAASAQVGNDSTLADDHPISFTYDATLATTDGELTAPTSLPISLPLFSGKMECATCHDVHNGGAAAAVNIKLLNVTPAGSAICLACHIK